MEGIDNVGLGDFMHGGLLFAPQGYFCMCQRFKTASEPAPGFPGAFGKCLDYSPVRGEAGRYQVGFTVFLCFEDYPFGSC